MGRWGFFFRRWSRHRAIVGKDGVLNLALGIVRELLRPRLGEIHAVGRSQAADLALEIGAMGGEISVLVDEPVPHVHKGDAGLFGPAAVEVVEISDIRSRPGAAHRRKPDPEDRHPLALEDGDHFVDALSVAFGPRLRMELVDGGRPGSRRWLGGWFFRCRLALLVMGGGIAGLWPRSAGLGRV